MRVGSLVRYLGGSSWNMDTGNRPTLDNLIIGNVYAVTHVYESVGRVVSIKVSTGTLWHYIEYFEDAKKKFYLEVLDD